MSDLRNRAAKVIDTSWCYSWHWGKHPNERHWTMDALHDCTERISRVEADLRALKAMRQELTVECPKHYPSANDSEV